MAKVLAKAKFVSLNISYLQINLEAIQEFQ